MIWAGGGVLRAGARTEPCELAERLDVPVATTYMGKGALPDEHPLAAGCGCDEAALQELLTEADVMLCVGTELGAETTGQYTLRFSGRLIQIDAAPARIGASYPALALVGDAKSILRVLIERVPARPPSGARDRVATVRGRITDGLQRQGRETELALLQTVQEALAPDAISCWDMTILGYWAAPHLRLGACQQFLYPLGSGTLGYAWPAAIGASLAHPGRMVLAVVGDGGIQYALGELGAAVQHGVNAKLLIVDDGAYGILREYQRDAFGHTPQSSCQAMTWPPWHAGSGRRSPLPAPQSSARSSPGRWPTTVPPWSCSRPGSPPPGRLTDAEAPPPGAQTGGAGGAQTGGAEGGQFAGAGDAGGQVAAARSSSDSAQPSSSEIAASDIATYSAGV